MSDDTKEQSSSPRSFALAPEPSPVTRRAIELLSSLSGAADQVLYEALSCLGSYRATVSRKRPKTSGVKRFEDQGKQQAQPWLRLRRSLLSAHKKFESELVIGALTKKQKESLLVVEGLILQLQGQLTVGSEKAKSRFAIIDPNKVRFRKTFRVLKTPPSPHTPMTYEELAHLVLVSQDDWVPGPCSQLVTNYEVDPESLAVDIKEWMRTRTRTSRPLSRG